MAIKAVGFDIDGTLYPNYRAQFRSFLFILRNFKVILAFSRVRRAMRENADDVQIIREPADAEAGYLAVELRIPIGRAQKIRDELIYLGWEKCFRRVRPSSGVRECLKLLRSRGYRIAALSDFPVGNKLRYMGIDDLFDVCLGFPDSANLKPACEPFLLMAKRLEVEPEQIIYIGNRLDYDVEGAGKAGMQAGIIIHPGFSNFRIGKIPENVKCFRRYDEIARYILSEADE